MNLAEFLLARIAEREQAAKTCAEAYPVPWDVSDRGWMAKVSADAPNFTVVTSLDQDQVPVVQDRWLGDYLEHIARWDPARVLAECEAKRRIVALYEVGECPDPCHNETAYQAMMVLAGVDDDHPDYRDEWKP